MMGTEANSEKVGIPEASSKGRNDSRQDPRRSGVCGGVAMAFRQASPTRGQVQGLGCVMTKAPPGQGPQPGAPLGLRLL